MKNSGMFRFMVPNDYEILKYGGEVTKDIEFGIEMLLEHLPKEQFSEKTVRDNLQKYNFTKGFFGTNGLNRTSGFTTPDINEAMIKECALKHTQKPYILCDSSKFLQTCPVSFGEFHSARIITDRYPEESMETEGHIIIAK